MEIDKDISQIVKDIIKALSIFITQIFSIVTFYQILFSNYMTDATFKHIIIIFAILFSLVFIIKTAILVFELVVKIKQLNQEKNATIQNTTQNNQKYKHK